MDKNIKIKVKENGPQHKMHWCFREVAWAGITFVAGSVSLPGNSLCILQTLRRENSCVGIFFPRVDDCEQKRGWDEVLVFYLAVERRCLKL